MGNRAKRLLKNYHKLSKIDKQEVMDAILDKEIKIEVEPIKAEPIKKKPKKKKKKIIK